MHLYHRGAQATATIPDQPGEDGPAVCIRGLDFSYEESGRRSQVLFDVDLDIWPGEVVLLTGPSGCGKTTLLTLIGGLRTVQSGELTVLGHELHDCDPEGLVSVRRHIGFIFQMHNLLEFLTARQNVQMALQLHPQLKRAEMSETAERMLELVGLGPGAMSTRPSSPAGRSSGCRSRGPCRAARA